MDVSAKGSGRSQVCQAIRQVHNHTVRNSGDCVRYPAVLRKRPAKYLFHVLSLITRLFDAQGLDSTPGAIPKEVVVPKAEKGGAAEK